MTITNHFGTSSVKPWDNGRADTYSSKWVRHSNWIHCAELVSPSFHPAILEPAGFTDSPL